MLRRGPVLDSVIQFVDWICRCAGVRYWIRWTNCCAVTTRSCVNSVRGSVLLRYSTKLVLDSVIQFLDVLLLLVLVLLLLRGIRARRRRRLVRLLLLLLLLVIVLVIVLVGVWCGPGVQYSCVCCCCCCCCCY